MYMNYKKLCLIPGPSFAVDTACSSSMVAMHQAITAMQTGQCDAAIVAGVNLLLKPGNALNFHHLSMLSPQGNQLFLILW